MTRPTTSKTWTSHRSTTSPGPLRLRAPRRAICCWSRLWMSSRFRTSHGGSRASLTGAMGCVFLRGYPNRLGCVLTSRLGGVPRRDLSFGVCLLVRRLYPNRTDQPRSAKAIWDFEGIYCTSRHIPHVKFAGLIHPGILGCAPSAEVLNNWNTREGELIAANKLDREVALP